MQRFNAALFAFAPKQANDDRANIDTLAGRQDCLTRHAFEQDLGQIGFPAGARSLTAVLLLDWR